MKPRKDVNSADIALTVRNTMWALPYLLILGIFWGFLVGGSLGALVGLLAAAAASAVVGSATTVFTGALSGSAVNVFYGMGRKTIGLRERLAGDLSVAKHHKLYGRFEEAWIKTEGILAEDPEFPEALFLKAQILWDGFGDAETAKRCLLKIIKTEPDKKAVIHCWALNLYGEIQKKIYFKDVRAMENVTG